MKFRGERSRERGKLYAAVPPARTNSGHRPGDRHASAGTNRDRSTLSMISFKTVAAPPRSS